MPHALHSPLGCFADHPAACQVSIYVNPTQFAVGDLNADGRVDIVIGNKKGGFVFRSEAPAR